MDNSHFETRIAKLEKQATINRYIMYGLFSTIIPIFLMGQVTAQNEVMNVGRIVASEYILSKDGEEYGRWFVEPEKQLTAEEMKAREEVSLVEALPEYSRLVEKLYSSHPAYSRLVMGSDENGSELSTTQLSLRKKDQRGDVFAGIDLIFGFSISDGSEHLSLNALSGLHFLSLDEQDTNYITLSRDEGLHIETDYGEIKINDSNGSNTIRSNSIVLHDKSGEGNGIIVSGDYDIASEKGIQISANNESAKISIGNFYDESGTATLESNYTSSGLVMYGPDDESVVLASNLFLMSGADGYAKGGIKFTANDGASVEVGRINIASNNQDSSITISDANGQDRAVIGNVDLVTKRTGDTTKRSASSITLFNEDGNVIETLPR